MAAVECEYDYSTTATKLPAQWYNRNRLLHNSGTDIKRCNHMLADVKSRKSTTTVYSIFSVPIYVTITAKDYTVLSLILRMKKK